MRARASAPCDTEQANQVAFQPGEVVVIPKHEAPLIVDTASTTTDGFYSIDADEHLTLLEAESDRGGLEAEPASKSRRTDKSDSDATGVVGEWGEARGEYEGCRGADSLTPLHQVLPYGS